MGIGDRHELTQRTLDDRKQPVSVADCPVLEGIASTSSWSAVEQALGLLRNLHGPILFVQQAGHSPALLINCAICHRNKPVGNRSIVISFRTRSAGANQSLGSARRERSSAASRTAADNALKTFRHPDLRLRPLSQAEPWVQELAQGALHLPLARQSPLTHLAQSTICDRLRRVQLSRPTSLRDSSTDLSASAPRPHRAERAPQGAAVDCSPSRSIIHLQLCRS
jgi:hypothetical protein